VDRVWVMVRSIPPRPNMSTVTTDRTGPTSTHTGVGLPAPGRSVSWRGSRSSFETNSAYPFRHGSGRHAGPSFVGGVEGDARSTLFVTSRGRRSGVTAGARPGRDRGPSPALDVGSTVPALGDALAAILGDPGGRRGEGPRRAALDLPPGPEGGGLLRERSEISNNNCPGLKKLGASVVVFRLQLKSLNTIRRGFAHERAEGPAHTLTRERVWSKSLRSGNSITPRLHGPLGTAL